MAGGAAQQLPLSLIWIKRVNALSFSLVRATLGLWSVAMVKNRCLCLLGLVTLAACHTPPPRPWLRYELDGGTDWSQQGAGKFRATMHGVNATVDLYSPDTRILVVVENQTEASIKLALGPESGASKDPIGEVLLREIASPVTGGPAMQSYVSMQPLMVDAGWRATFYIDRPLGRDLQLGQYFVFSTEVKNSAGELVRRVLPLVGKMSGTVPIKSS